MINDADILKIEQKLMIKNKNNFQLLEVFNRPWYMTQKDKKKRLGNLFKATLKL